MEVRRGAAGRRGHVPAEQPIGGVGLGRRLGDKTRGVGPDLGAWGMSAAAVSTASVFGPSDGSVIECSPVNVPRPRARLTPYRPIREPMRRHA